MSESGRAVIKHPNSAYLIVGFVAICATAMLRTPLAALLYLVPLAGIVYIRRVATIVDGDGITARTVLGSASVGWDDLAGLRTTDRGPVYAVAVDGTQVRLPCLRSTHLTPLIAASGGRITDPLTVPLPEPVQKDEPTTPEVTQTADDTASADVTDAPEVTAAPDAAAPSGAAERSAATD